MNTSSVRAAVLAALACLAVGACDRTADNRTSDRTVGQKLDTAMEKTQEKLNSAGEKIAQATERVVDKTKEVAADVKNTTITTEVGTNAREARASDAGRAMGDTAITASVKADFIKDPDLSVLKIDVDTRDGVVTLNGLAGNEPARLRAEKMASAVKGVKEVRNFLVVKRA